MLLLDYKLLMYILLNSIVKSYVPGINIDLIKGEIYKTTKVWYTTKTLLLDLNNLDDSSLQDLSPCVCVLCTVACVISLST